MVNLLSTPIEAFGEWFAAIADRLLNETEFLVNGVAHRLIEDEFYRHSHDHADPFAHRDPIQCEMGRWYFHRTGGRLRGGSFKGLDLTFGDSTSHAGILLRGLEKPDGSIVDGPSLLVDHLLKTTHSNNVETLERLAEKHKAWDLNSPLALAPIQNSRKLPLLRTMRVGLSFKRSAVYENIEPIRFVKYRYRWLSEPRRTRKGRTHMVISLFLDGFSHEEIAERVGCPLRGVQSRLAEFEDGQKESNPGRYFGKELKNAEFCQFLGMIHRNERAG